MAAKAASGQQRGTHIRALWLFVAAIVMVLAACGTDADSRASVVADAADSAGDAVDFDTDEAEEAMEDDAMEDEEAFESISGSVDGQILTSSEAPAATIPATDVVDSDDSGTNDSDTNESGADQSDAEGETQAASANAPALAAQRGREIIFTANIAVGVDDVESAGEQAASIITDIGGFIANQNTQGGSEPRSEITFKVDPDRFSEALERLGGIGELRNQTISSDDVTERVVDLQSRIEVTQLGVNRLREAMEDAVTLTDFAELENLLLSREADLEVMRGTLRTLRDRIDLATITLILEQDRVTNVVALGITVYEGHDKGIGCPGTRVENLTFEPGDEITLCFDVRNDGDQTLTGVTITESVLGIEGNEDLIPVFGNADALRPGQSLLQAFELVVERDRSLRAGVTSLPTDGVSSEPVGPAVRGATTPVIRVNEDAVDAGFGDGFDAAVSLLERIWQVIRVLAGFILPMLILLPIVWLAWMLVRRMRTSRKATAAEKRAANQPPPPHHVQPAASQTPVAKQTDTDSDEAE